MHRDHNDDPYDIGANPYGEAYADASYGEAAQVHQGYPSQSYPSQSYPSQSYPSEGYADPAYVDPAYVDPAYASYEMYASESGAYEGAAEVVPLVSPRLIHQLSATPLMLDGMPAVEIAMTVTRDYDRAAELCPYEGYDILGWHNDVLLAVRTNRHGHWVAFAPSAGGFQPLGIGDAASVNLDRQEVTGVWRFIPEMLGQFDIWAYVYVNGVFVAFDQMAASNHYIDANGAARMSVLL